VRDEVETAFKVRENKARRILPRLGYRLEKSPRRDPRAPDFGRYHIAQAVGTAIVAGEAGHGFGMTLAEVETWTAGVPARNSLPNRPPRTSSSDTMVDLFVADCRDALRRLPAGHFHTCVTSPPYYFLRDSGDARQIGLEPTPNAYVEALVRVFRLVRRVLRSDGTAWINIADTYCTRRAIRADGRRSVQRDMDSGRNSQRAWRESSAAGRALHSSRLRAAGLKDKDLMLLPARLALALQRDGWYVRSAIAWVKTHTVPDPASDRPARGHETVLLLAKSESYFFDATALRERGADGRQRPGRDVWTIRPNGEKGEHTARMPVELAAKCILAGAPPGAWMLDPFAGSGTTGTAAAQHGRHATLVELNADYAKTIRKRLGARVCEA
jgi:DNA modification methylase